jgi:NAD(P)-dependent dehydrogenase (short-subunit alcohol dehydrogenase family)
MKIQGSIALVTGANRGIGQAFVEALLQRGAAKVYVSARDTSSLSKLLSKNDPRVVAVKLDVTNDADIAAAAKSLGDVSLLINNAGFAGGGSAFSTLNVAAARKEMDVNYFGVLSLVQAFAPSLKAAGGGTVVNVLSFLALATLPVWGTYSASKAATLAVTRSLRAELARQGTAVIGVLPVQVDTEMGQDLPPPRLSPAEVVADSLDAVETGAEEVFPGEQTRQMHAAFSANPKGVQAQFSTMIPG